MHAPSSDVDEQLNRFRMPVHGIEFEIDCAEIDTDTYNLYVKLSYQCNPKSE